MGAASGALKAIQEQAKVQGVAVNDGKVKANLR